MNNDIIKGTLVRWNIDKGFGFIKPDYNDVKEIFIHITAFNNMPRKPNTGDIIFYQVYFNKGLGG